MRNFRLFGGMFVAVTVATMLPLLLSGCAGNSADELYNGPGSRWDMHLADDETFTITRRDDISSPVTLTVSGTYERLASGFLELTVSSSDGSSGPAAGDAAWALEIPGYFFLVKPLTAGSDQLIPMVSAGSCPVTAVDSNWVLVKKADTDAANDASRDFFGTFHFDPASGMAELPALYALANNFADLGSVALSAGTCTGGIMEVADTVMYITSNGGAIVHTDVSTPSDASFIFALSQKAITDITNIDGNYVGILFDDTLASGAKNAPLSLSCTNGACTGNMVTDIATGATSSDTVTITLDATPDELGPGLVTGTISNDGGSGNLACMVDRDVLGTGKKIVNCVGQSPGDNAMMFNVLFASVSSP